jgi:hypothetical protein
MIKGCRTFDEMKVGREKQKYSEKTRHSSSLSTTNVKQPDLEKNPDQSGGNPAAPNIG